MFLSKNTFAWLLLVSVAFSCTSNTNLPVDESNNTGDSASVIKPDTNSQTLYTSPETIKQTISRRVEDWNLAQNNKDVNSLSKLYAEEVNLYGTVYGNAEAIAHKKQFFAEKKQTYQQILGGANVVVHSPFVAKASFIKKVISGKKTNSYNAYLMFEKINNDWKIVAESDESADQQTAETKSAPIEISTVTNCERAAEAVFRSSKYVQEILKNPHTKFRLEYKPGDEGNSTNRYWFWIYANAPNSGSTETYGRFQVDPKTGKVYEFTASDENPKLVDSDAVYEAEVKKHCANKP